MRRGLFAGAIAAGWAAWLAAAVADVVSIGLMLALAGLFLVQPTVAGIDLFRSRQ